MDNDILNTLNTLAAQGPGQSFGDARLVSNRTLGPFSAAGQQAAQNLIDKAARALDAEDPDRAWALAARTARLPFDDHEQAHPAALMITTELFSLVVDELEASDPEDSAWLDAAIDALSSADDVGRCDLRDSLQAIHDDYQLTEQEKTTLRAAIAPVPDRPPLRDQRLEESEFADSIISILAVCRTYRALLNPTDG